jgi:hypothetical protein
VRCDENETFEEHDDNERDSKEWQKYAKTRDRGENRKRKPRRCERTRCAEHAFGRAAPPHDDGDRRYENEREKRLAIVRAAFRADAIPGASKLKISPVICSPACCGDPARKGGCGSLFEYQLQTFAYVSPRCVGFIIIFCFE